MKAITATALAALALTCATAPALAQKAKDTLRFPVPDPDAGIDTYLLPSSFNNVWGPSVYDMLLGFDAEKGQFVGHLAKGVTQPDPMTYDFDLRTDVKWHDGQVMDADDVVHTLTYLIDPKVNLRFKAYWAWIKSVEKLSASKVRIHAHQAAPDSLMYLASRSPMYPEHGHGPAANKLDFAAKPIGTGPMRVVQLDQNTGIVAERYKDYVPSPVKRASGVGRIIAAPIKDTGTLTATLLTGEADIAVDLPPDQAEDLEKSGRFDVTLVDRLSYSFMGFPSKGWEAAKPLADIRVRTAIAKAIDRDAVIKLKLGVMAKGQTPTEALCSKEQLGCGYTKLMPAYDPAGAKKLLAEAGYADGFDVTISCFPASAPDAIAISGMLRAAGIRATVRQHPTAQRVQLINQGKIEIGYYGWSGGGMMEVSGQLGRHVDSKEYDDPLLAKLTAATTTIMDDAKRRTEVAKVFDHITDNAYAFAIMQNYSYFTHTKDVQLINPRAVRAENVNPHEFAWK
jgi:peptide/nickel transport system substrate-binding protein